MTTGKESLDAKVLKWAGVAMVAFLLGAFVSATREPSFQTAAVGTTPAALHARMGRTPQDRCPPVPARCT